MSVHSTHTVHTQSTHSSHTAHTQPTPPTLTCTVHRRTGRIGQTTYCRVGTAWPTAVTRSTAAQRRRHCFRHESIGPTIHAQSSDFFVVHKTTDCPAFRHAGQPGGGGKVVLGTSRAPNQTCSTAKPTHWTVDALRTVDRRKHPRAAGLTNALKALSFCHQFVHGGNDGGFEAGKRLCGKSIGARMRVCGIKGVRVTTRHIVQHLWPVPSSVAHIHPNDGGSGHVFDGSNHVGR